MADRKLVNMKIDVDILKDFDAWCKEHGTTRTNAVEQYMLRQVSHDHVRKILKPVMTSKPAAPKETTSVNPSDCVHPTGRRIAGVCMVCGKDVGKKG